MRIPPNDVVLHKNGVVKGTGYHSVVNVPGLDALHRELSPLGLKVFAVNEAETPAKIRPTAAKLNLTTPILRDADRKVSDAYLMGECRGSMR